jgi:hypothetical protein
MAHPHRLSHASTHIVGDRIARACFTRPLPPELEFATDTLFKSNSARLEGGGVEVFAQGDVSPLANIFDDTASIKSNSAGQDGGGFCDMSDVLTFPTGVVSHNTPDDFCVCGPGMN